MKTIKEREILQMTIKIMARYKITDVKIATKTAKTLYEANIRIDKFQPEYYHGLFDLDEIVIYILNKKTINFMSNPLNKTKYTFLPEEINHDSNATTKIIPYTLKKKKSNYYYK